MPLTSPFWRSVLPKRTSSSPVHAWAAGHGRSQGAAGSIRHASSDGSYAAPSFTGPERPNPPQIRTSEPVQTARASARAESGPSAIARHPEAGSYAAPSAKRLAE
jgi:hypothetical protein